MQDTLQLLDLMVPFRIEVDKPGPPLVKWVDQDGIEGHQPFLDEEILDFAFQSNDKFAETRLMDLLTSAQNRGGLKPNGFIFHMSRCGSTLLNNMLCQSDENISLSEPQILAQILEFLEEDNYDYVMELFKASVSALGRSGDHQKKNFVIKYASCVTVFMKYIVEAYPNTPRIFIYRNPAEVLVSNMKDPSQNWITSEKVTGLTNAQMTQENSALENCAIALQRTCQAFLDHYDDNCLVFNYNQLSEAMFQEILDLFKIYPNPEDFRSMIGEMSFYSKDRTEKFTNDTEVKRKKISPKIQQVADQYLSEVYQKLESLRINFI